MDREILFRAKRIDKGEWVNGYVTRIKHSDDKGKVETYYFNALDELGWVAECAVSAETVCQYTGLTDKNGRKIFEGDICDRGEKFPEIVTYHDGDWTLDYSYSSGKESGYNYCNLGFYVKERGGVEVIGNIFDNPELLGTGSASGKQGNQQHEKRVIK